MFQLSREDADSLRTQFVTLKKSGRGKHRKYLPFAFTEQGVAMLSGVLQSPRAVQVNIAIMRAFVRMRRMLISHEELARKVDALARTVPGSKPGRAGRRGTRGSFRQLPHLLQEFHHPQGVRPAVQSLKPSMTRLTRLREEEAENLRSQIATGSNA